MGKQKKTRKFAEVRARASTIELPHPPPSPHTLQVKRMISPKDERLNFKEKGAARAPQPPKMKRSLHLPPILPPCRNRSLAPAASFQSSSSHATSNCFPRI